MSPAEALLHERIAAIQRMVALTRARANQIRVEVGHEGYAAPGHNERMLKLANQYEHDSVIIIALMRELSDVSTASGAS